MLALKAQPSSSRSAGPVPAAFALKAVVTAPPSTGKANAASTAFLAKRLRLGLAKRNVGFCAASANNKGNAP
ncbi:MAG: DUF167 domain-containing protein [Rhodospirillales bacterium]|nr:DUF167 domain-containing protein [Rhodospirillales bacterium]